MLLDRWRAQRAIATRTGPSPIEDFADPRLVEVVEALKPAVGSLVSLGDPSWHLRWDGALQLVGLDATSRSVTDVRQRLVRLAHECDLRHMARRARRILLVVLCTPREGEGLQGWFKRLDDDQGEVGASDWRAARRRMAILALDGDGNRRLFGGDRDVREAAAPLLDGAPAGS
ncbi:MAG: hypothetical protein ACYTCU_09280 [Planctomycetota bacterium]|jgi:hypothetical protein